MPKCEILFLAFQDEQNSNVFSVENYVNVKNVHLRAVASGCRRFSRVGLICFFFFY